MISTLIAVSYTASLFYGLFAKTTKDFMLVLVTIFAQLWLFYLLIQAEVIGISFLILYIGAVSILFVFALMAVGIRERVSLKAPDFLTIVIFVGLLFLAYTLYTYASLRLLDNNLSIYTLPEPWLTGEDVTSKHWSTTTDIALFSLALYAKYRTLFWCAGLTLLTAVFGIIALALPSPKKPSKKN